MSITATLANARSGLAVAARAAEVVSSNVANALTEGYARREVEVTAKRVGTAGQGAQVAAVRRDTDPRLIADRRAAAAAAGDRALRAGALGRIEAAVGAPGSEGALTDRIAGFERALIEAASRPESPARLAAAADAARALAATLRDASAEVQAVRAEADEGIAEGVARINAALAQVADLNGRIGGLAAAGRDTSALMDERQRIVDGIAALVPLREVDRGGGTVALYTTGGAALLDGTRPAVLGFERIGTIVAEMTRASGALAGLTLDGRPVETGAQGLLAGGELAARFALRDEIAPNMQAELDAVARDLIARMGDDPTRPAGAAGLFADGSAPFDPSREAGIAARIRLDPAADPERGGAAWRLRDGLGAAAPAAGGDPALLTARAAAVAEARPTASGSAAGGVRSLAELAGQAVSTIAQARLAADGEASFTAARATALREAEAAHGVDTDRELQDLLLVERAYGANARIVQTVDAMIRMLLEI
jgi:flagellar hook-associated protein 1 FlgK